MHKRRSTFIATALMVAGVSLAACGTPQPKYGGGNNGGGVATTSTTTPVVSPTSPDPALAAAIGSATRFVTANWSLNPRWPSPNYVDTIDRPYLTPGMITQYATQSARPLPSAIENQWLQEVRFKVGYVVDVTSAWVVKDAGVTPTTCVVEVMFITNRITAGVVQPATSTSMEYAFQMRKVNAKWLVASPPEQPE